MKKAAKKKRKAKGRPRKAAKMKVIQITITITPERLRKVDSRDSNRSRSIGEMIDEAE